MSKIVKLDNSCDTRSSIECAIIENGDCKCDKTEGTGPRLDVVGKSLMDKTTDVKVNKTGLKSSQNCILKTCKTQTIVRYKNKRVHRRYAVCESVSEVRTIKQKRNKTENVTKKMYESHMDLDDVLRKEGYDFLEKDKDKDNILIDNIKFSV